MSSPASLRRGQVWRADDELLWLIVSGDHWNGLRKNSVVVAPVEPGEPETPFDVPLDLGGEDHVIYADTLQQLKRVDLGQQVANAGSAVMGVVDERLEEVLGDRPVASGVWPKLFPRRGDYRHVDLQLPGEASKPHIVVSCDAFAAEVEHAHAVLVRKGTSGVPPMAYEVPLAGRGAGDGIGKVMCWDIRTVRASRLIVRPGDSALTGPVQAEVHKQVRLMLGLP